MIPRLKEKYEKTIIGELKSKFSMKNKLMVPRFMKIVLNMGLGKDANDKKIVQNCIEDMALIAGQKPIVTKFKKSISNFIRAQNKAIKNSMDMHTRIPWLN